MENNRKDFIEENDNVEEKTGSAEENNSLEQSAEKTDPAEMIQSENGEAEETNDEISSSGDDAEKVNIEEDSSGCAPSEDTDEVEEEKTEESEKKPKKKKRSTFDMIRTVLIFLFIAVFIVSAFMIARTVIAGKKAQKEYSDMNDDFFDGVDRKDGMSYLDPAVLDKPTPKFGSAANKASGVEYTVLETNSPFYLQYKEKLLEYKAINPDIYGWIQVDGTNISYPCVKGKDNDYYLNRTATLEHNVNGAIFADFRCEDKVLENPNLVFYGHNMIYPNAMFNEITKFLDQNFFSINRYVTIYTTEGIYRYEVFAVYQTTSTFRYCQIGFMNAESFVKWCNEMSAKSIFLRDTGDFTESSRVVTLSTCTNGNIDDRYALQARLVSIEKAPDVVIELPDGDEFDKKDPNADAPLDDSELPLQSMDPEDTAIYEESKEAQSYETQEPIGLP